MVTDRLLAGICQQNYTCRERVLGARAQATDEEVGAAMRAVPGRLVGGVAQRPLPVDPEMPLVAGSEIRMEPLRAPYWHPGTPRAPCMMPEPLC